MHQLEEAVALLKPEQEQFAMLYDRTGFRLRNLDLDVISKAVKVRRLYQPLSVLVNGTTGLLKIVRPRRQDPRTSGHLTRLSSIIGHVRVECGRKVLLSARCHVRCLGVCSR